MKGLRNVLTHKYGEIKDNIVYELLTERLDDFEIIIGAVEKYLKNYANIYKPLSSIILKKR